MRKMNLFRVISVFVFALLICAGTGMETARADLIWPPDGFDGSETDYMVLVNKENRIPGNWEEHLELVIMMNSLGDEVQVEEKAYDAYLDLKKALAAAGYVYHTVDQATSLMFVAGFLGGMSTFSAAVSEMVSLARNRRWWLALVYAVISIVVPLVCAAAGWALVALAR